MVKSLSNRNGLSFPFGIASQAWPLGVLLAFSIGLVLVSASQAEPGEPLKLITAEEAALQDAVGSRGGLDYENGPIIKLMSPESGKSYSGSFEIMVNFLVGHDGHPIDLSSLKVLYKKFIDIDITSRLSDHLSPKGIHAPSVELPSGRHAVEIYLEDVEENATRKTFTVTVKDTD